MSLGFSAGIARHAEDMGAWAEYSDAWYREALQFLNTHDLWQRHIDLLNGLGIDPLNPVTNGQKASVIALAICYGKEFTFYETGLANDFIVRLLRQWSVDFEAPLRQLFTPLEQMELGGLK